MRNLEYNFKKVVILFGSFRFLLYLCNTNKSSGGIVDAETISTVLTLGE